MANYRYLGASDIVYDNANDEYDLHFVQGDHFTMYRHGQVYVVQHEDDPSIIFKLNLKEGNNLHHLSEELLSVEVDPENPPYMMFKPKFDMVPLLYNYFNRTYFNGECPVVKFRKSSNSKIWGMAELEWFKGKPVYTFHINESSMIDRVLFTNTILHEMIHLFHFARGAKLRYTDAEQSRLHLHSDHGPLFVEEMMRLNAKGFHIIKEGTHEEIARNSTDDFYAIVASEVQQGRYESWYAWYTDKELTQEDTDRLASLLKDLYPHAEYEIKLIKTKDRNVTHGTNIKSTKNFVAGSLKKKFPGGVNTQAGEVLYTTWLRPSVAVQLPDYKETPDIYAMPLDRFYRAMKSYTDDRMVLRARWMKFPSKMLTSQIDKKISILVGRMGRGGIEDGDIVNNLTDIRMAYDERYTHQQYIDAMNAFIKKYDHKGLLVNYAKIMRIVA